MPVPAVGTPSELPLVSPNSENLPPFTKENVDDKVQMKKQLGLLEGVSIILGIIFGSGELLFHLFVPVRSQIFQKIHKISQESSKVLGNYLSNNRLCFVLCTEIQMLLYENELKFLGRFFVKIRMKIEIVDLFDRILFTYHKTF